MTWPQFHDQGLQIAFSFLTSCFRLVALTSKRSKTIQIHRDQMNPCPSITPLQFRQIRAFLSRVSINLACTLDAISRSTLMRRWRRLKRKLLPGQPASSPAPDLPPSHLEPWRTLVRNLRGRSSGTVPCPRPVQFISDAACTLALLLVFTKPVLEGAGYDAAGKS